MLLVAMMLLIGSETPAQTAPDPKDALVCKRETPIGSLIASRKVCLTKAQWEARTRDGNEEARRQAYENMGRPSCNDIETC